MGDLLELDSLGDNPFEVDAQEAHLFKHPYLGMQDVLVVPIAPARDENSRRCRLIGC